MVKDKMGIKMMEKREKNQDDFDLETFVELFDTAMTSNNPTIQRAFKNLMMVAAIVNAEDANHSLSKGPLRRLIDDVANLHRRVNTVENNKYTSNGPTTVTVGTPYYGANGSSNWPTPYSNSGYLSTANTGSTVNTTNLGAVSGTLGPNASYKIDQTMIDNLYKASK